MSKQDFTEKQLKELQANPNVISATEKRIVYTTEFKRKFIEEYRNGLGPREIFIRAGFDVDVLGYKRIERASDRWRQAYNQGLLGENEDFVTVHRERLKKSGSLAEKLREQDNEIARLESELAEIKRELIALRG